MNDFRPNDPCWCGSGKKYKKCHLNRGEAEPYQHHEIDSIRRQISSSNVCLAPKELHASCSPNVIGSHTVPRSSSLKAIARDGHVLSYIPTLQSLERSDGKVQLESIGINKASTFPGFCSNHDNQLFAPVEVESFTGTQEQLGLLLYRAVCKEFHAKKYAADVWKCLHDLDKGHGLPSQIAIQNDRDGALEGLRRGFDDVTFLKTQLDKCIVGKDFSCMRGLVLEYPDAPAIMCSGAFDPKFDFCKNKLQDLEDLDTTPEIISLSLFRSIDSGFAVFSWIDSGRSVSSRLVRSFIESEEQNMTSRLVGLAFGEFENIYVSPDWWKGLESSGQQEKLLKRAALKSHPSQLQPKDYLVSDNFYIDEWELENIYTVGGFEIND